MIHAFLSRPLWVEDHVGKHLLRLEEKLPSLGFAVRTVGRNLTSLSCPFDEVVEAVRACDCAIILGLPYARVTAGKVHGEPIGSAFALASEWNQIEASIALMLHKPTLMMRHRGVAPRGLFDRGSANVFVHEFHTVGPGWIDKLVPKLRDLRQKVEARQPR